MIAKILVFRMDWPYGLKKKWQWLSIKLRWYWMLTKALFYLLIRTQQNWCCMRQLFRYNKLSLHLGKTECMPKRTWFGVLWTNQKTDMFLFCWLCAHAMLDITNFPAFVVTNVKTLIKFIRLIKFLSF